MPFAFVIDEQDIIRAKGVISKRQHLDFLLADAAKEPAETIAQVQYKWRFARI
jgi:hypothetical protein